MCYESKTNVEKREVGVPKYFSKSIIQYKRIQYSCFNVKFVFIQKSDKKKSSSCSSDNGSDEKGKNDSVR